MHKVRQRAAIVQSHARSVRIDMTQEEFASRIGVSQSYLSAVEHGRNEAGAEVLLAISREFRSPSNGCSRAIPRSIPQLRLSNQKAG